MGPSPVPGAGGPVSTEVVGTTMFALLLSRMIPDILSDGKAARLTSTFKRTSSELIPAPSANTLVFVKVTVRLEDTVSQLVAGLVKLPPTLSISVIRIW